MATAQPVKLDTEKVLSVAEEPAQEAPAMIAVPAVDLAQLVRLAHLEGPETREHRDRLDSPANRNLRLANKSPK